MDEFKDCICGCGTKIPSIDKYGKERFYALNHHRKNKPSPNRKNYRVLVGKYWYLYLPNHPHCTKRGYYLESRYNMEKHLGRYLTPYEVVHHIDSKPELENANRIDNLKLYSCHNEHISIEHNPEIDKSSRVCKICGSNKTGMQKKDGKYYPKWLKYEDGFICKKCSDAIRWKKIQEEIKKKRGF